MLRERVSLDDSEWIRLNLSRQFDTFRTTLKKFVSGLFKCKRTAATHILVVMIIPEERNRKPYALPVQCIPYVGLKDDQVRQIFDVVITYMTSKGMKGMKIAGSYKYFLPVWIQ